MPRLSAWEIALILVIVLIVFGAGKLPQVGRSMGEAIKEFRKSKDDKDEVAQTNNSKAAEGDKKN
ncbi:MAG: twin-arginine translocase TatA/TatE family subunit [Dehalococcoidia bacterium]|nr:twin-arginine translocase TatA/TatE family subunit [Dehalococcoidia bacterium]